MKIFDEEAYASHPGSNWVYNKLTLSEKLGYVCGPAGVKVPESGEYIIRPIMNLSGMGIKAKIVECKKGKTPTWEPGLFWCEVFKGNHYSVDFEHGRIVRVTQGIHGDDITKWEKWIAVKKDFAFPHVLWQFKDKPNVNCEFIGNKLIEVHIRKNPDFSYNNNVFIPVWEGDVIDVPDGYRYVECSDVNGRIGAYVDTT